MTLGIGNEYRSGQRIELIDFLRGFCLVVMTIDHLPYSALEKFTWQTFGFISAAEGFVFLSGLVVGRVYGRTARTRGLSYVTNRALRRFRTIYLTNAIFISLAFLVCSHGLAVIGNGIQPSWRIWGESLALVSAPGFSEILRLYCVFFLFTPIIFWTLLKYGTRIVVISSCTLWLVARLGYGMTAIPNSGYFDLVSWQLLFVVGICCGFWQPVRVTRRRSWQEQMLAMAAGAVIITFFIVRHQRLLFGTNLSPDLEWLLTWRRTLPLRRLIDFAALTYFVYRFRSAFDSLLQSILGKALIYLGQHSLPVFVWGVSLSMMTYAAELRGHWYGHSPLWRAILDCVMLVSCFAVARVHSCYRTLIDLMRQSAASTKLIDARARA